MIIILTILFGLLVFKFRKQIKRHSTILFGITTVIAVISYIVDFELVTIGTLGLVLFLLVMFAGAFKKTSKVGKGLKSIRKELSIMGFILLIPHFTKYLLEFINGEYPWEWYGIIGAIIMIPLFITSFTKVKRLFTHKTWKNIQRYSYMAYVLIFVHLVIVANEAEAVIYSVLLIAYLLLKYKNYFSKSERSIVRATSVVSLVAALAFVILYNVDVEVETISISTGFDSVVLTEEFNIETYEDGLYYGSASGFKGRTVEVEVEVENGEIVAIDVLDYGSTSPHRGIDFYDAVDQVVEEMLENPGAEVDAISEATKSTEGVINAVQDALN